MVTQRIYHSWILIIDYIAHTYLLKMALIIYLLIYLLTTWYFNALQCYSELTMITCSWLTIALSFFDNGK